MATQEKKSKTFLAVFLGTTSAMKRFMKLPPKVRKEREAAGMQARYEWVARNERAIVTTGGPLGTTKRIGRKGIADTSNALGAFTIVKAESHAAAARLFKNHPHFTIFPGEAVEVMEILPIPGK